MSLPEVGDEVEIRICGDGIDEADDWLALLDDETDVRLVCMKKGPQWCASEMKRDLRCQKIRLKVVAVESGAKREGCNYDHAQRLAWGKTDCPVCGPIEGATEKGEGENGRPA